MTVKFSNDASSTLTSGITAAATSLSVASAANFPSLSSGEYTYLTLSNVLDTQKEIVKCTAISGTTFTVTRGAESTTAQSFSSGDRVQIRITAGLFGDALDEKVDDSQVQTNVPSGAVFTDTVYSHPSTHSASMLTGALPAIDGSALINMPAGGASDIDGLSDGYNDGRSIGLGDNALANDDGTNNDNTALGWNALATSVSGEYNTGVGRSALEDVTTGIRHTAVGCNALKNVTTNHCNTALGFEAGQDITTGYNNTIIGRLHGSTSMNSTVLIGAGDVERLKINSTGLYVNGSTTALAGGASSIDGLSDAISGDASSYGIGDGALPSDDGTTNSNIAIGQNSMASMVSGNSNVALGGYSLQDNVSGYRSTAIGHYALNNSVVTTAAENVAVGYRAGRMSTTGKQNTLIGSEAGSTLTSGAYNILIGSMAGTSVTTGSSNTIIGKGGFNTSASLSSTVLIAAGSTERLKIDSTGLYVNGSTTALVGGASDIDGLSDGKVVGDSVGLGSGTLANIGATSYENSAFGINALNDVTTGSSNTAIGHSALRDNLTGKKNIAVGGYSMLLGGSVAATSTANTENTAVGYGSLRSNVSGNQNTAVGFNSMYGVVGGTATFNSSFGAHSLYQVSTGTQNTAIGNQALFDLTTGGYSTALGSYALENVTTGAKNIGIGYQAGKAVTTGSNNTVIGDLNGTASMASTVLIGAGSTERLKINSTGLYVNGSSTALAGGASDIDGLSDAFQNSNSLGLGTNALSFLNTGLKYNVAVGVSALQNTTSGERNVAVGQSAGNNNTTGSYNTSLGYQAAYTNTVGVGNTNVGAQSLSSNTGSNNTAVGKFAGKSITTGSNNTVIGLLEGTSAMASTVLIGAGSTERLKVDSTGLYVNGSTTALVGGGVEDFVASGTLPNGTPVILKTDGTVEAVDVSVANPNVISYGSTGVFNSAATANITATFDPNNSNKLLIVYMGATTGAVVGTVSGTTISFGTPVVFNPSYSEWISMAFDPNNSGKVVIVYTDGGNQDKGTAIVGTISGSSISFGTEQLFYSLKSNGQVIAFDPHTAGRFVVGYSDKSNAYKGAAILGTVSGTTMSFGSAVFFNNANYTSNINVAFDPNTANKLVISYTNGSNSNYGTAIVGTASGTSLSFGTAVVYNSATSTYNRLAFDPNTSNTGKFVVAYKNGNAGTAIVGTISGTSLSFGTATAYNVGATSNEISMSFDPNTLGNFVVAYSDTGTNFATAIVGTISGSTLTFGSEYAINTTGGTYSPAALSISFDSNSTGKFIFAFKNNGSSAPAGQGTYAIGQLPVPATNLTATNFIGISSAAYTNGQTAAITLKGGVTENQSGLTTGSIYYVQGDGTLATTASSPSVELGTALSATTLQIAGAAGSDGADGADGADGTNGTPLPTQTGNSGKYLTTDGSAASWGSGGATSIDDLSDGYVDSNNVALGTTALANLTSGERNTGLGIRALNATTNAYGNTGIGHDTLKNATGGGNTAIGDSALKTSTTAYGNTAVGQTALAWGVSSSQNTAVGANALRYNTSGWNQTAVGYMAGSSTTSASEITALGTNALYALTTGGSNTAVGAGAGKSITTGSNNTVIGSLNGTATLSNTVLIGAGTAERIKVNAHMVALGENALQNYTHSSGGAVAIGWYAGAALTTGQPNVAIGHEALKAATTASQNVVLGYRSGYSLTIGNQNVALGHQALFLNTTGSNNIAIGRALLLSTTGHSNVGVGAEALNAITTGASNIGIGKGAGDAITTGSNNTVIGDLAGSTTMTSTVLIGAGITERLKIDSTGLYVNGSSTALGGGGGPSNPTGLVSGRYYTGLYDSEVTSAANLPTSSVLYYPIMVHEDCTIDELCVTINGGTGNSGDLAQIALYGPVPDNLQSVPFITKTATFAVDSGYGKTLSITAQTVTKGIYLYSITTNTASLSVRKHNSQTKYINHMVGVNSPSFQGGCYGAEWSTNTVTTFPHSYPSTISASQAAHTGDAWQFKYGVQ